MSITLPQLAAISGIAAFYLITTCWRTYRPQHAGGGEGALTVWQLIAQVEAERQKRERVGRHRLREPADTTPVIPLSTPDPSPPPPELQRRVLDALRRL